MNDTPTIPTWGLMRLSQVLKLIPVSKSHWHASVASGRFPKPIKLGPRMAAYRVEDIKALIDRLSADSAEQKN